MAVNKESTRYFSSKHEDSIAKATGAKKQSNSGAGLFRKGDLVHNGADMLIEAKCCMSPKNSVSIKKEWIDKNKKESYAIRKTNNAICINFEPDGENYYLIDEKLFKFLIEKLEEDNYLKFM